MSQSKDLKEAEESTVNQHMNWKQNLQPVSRITINFTVSKQAHHAQIPSWEDLGALPEAQENNFIWLLR